MVDVTQCLTDAAQSFENGDIAESERLCIEVLKQKPENAAALLRRAQIANLYGKVSVAAEFLRRSLVADPKQRDVWLAMIVAYRDMGDTSAAELALVEMLQAFPGDHRPYTQLGLQKLIKSQFDQAATFLRRAIKEGAEEGVTYLALTRAEKTGIDDEIIPGLKQLFASKTTSLNNRIPMGFALANIARGAGDNKGFWSYLEKAHALQKSAQNQTVANHKKYLTRIRKAYTKKALEINLDGYPGPFTPIFIVGHPCSGSNVIEQILSCHSAVAAGGEMPFFPTRVVGSLSQNADGDYPEAIQELEQQLLAMLASEYYQMVRGRLPTGSYVTDGLPSNYQHIGLIRQLMPSAKIIHISRDPMDVAFSCYSNYLPGEAHYASDLDDFTDHHKSATDLMTHWRKILPGFILDVQFENLVTNRETEIRNILEFCDLAFEPACFRFEDFLRVDRNEALLQERLTLDASSIGVWKDFKKEMDAVKKPLS